MRVRPSSTKNVEEENNLLAPNPENVPDELKVRPQWVVWLIERRADQSGQQRPTKVPYNPATGTRASSTDLATWSSFEMALEALRANGSRYHGIGFVFSSGDPYTGIDLDKCRNPETGEIEPWAREWIARFDSYTEASPTGTGIHIITRGKTPHDGKATVDGQTVEIYSVARYFTVTGVRP